MTLNVTVLTENAIYQSADYRIGDFDTDKIINDETSKIVALVYEKWSGVISYTGLGLFNYRSTSDFIVEWLTGLENASFDEVAERLRDKGNAWLNEIAFHLGRKRHTFILAGFVSDRPKLALVSNFENCSGKNETDPESFLSISSKDYNNHPRVVITGRPKAVYRSARLSLKRLANKASVDPAQIRRKLIKVNSMAASTFEAFKNISPECSVISFRSDGNLSFVGNVMTRTLIWGRPDPTKDELSKALDFELGSLVQAAVATYKPKTPYAPCNPQTIMPDKSAGFTLREIRCKELASCRALKVNNSGIVLGDGYTLERLADSHLWITEINDEPKLIGLIGQSGGGINESSEIVTAAKMPDGVLHTARVKINGETRIVNCDYDTGATAINLADYIVGWVCIDSKNRGQTNYRPAAWILTQQYLLEDFGCDWGIAVDVNNEGIVLVVGYVGFQSRAILWDPLKKTHKVIDNGIGVYPIAITTDGGVLGSARDNNGQIISCIAKSGECFKKLDTEQGYFATSINDKGDTVGYVMRDGYDKPLLRRAEGEIIWLPYFDQHGCRPSDINDLDVIVGTAHTDHGSHALIWKTQEK